MKGFSFRLERILKLREDAEQRQARSLGDALREESTLDEMCETQSRQLSSIGDQLALKPGAVASAGMLRALSMTAEVAASQLEAAERSRDEARKLVEVERERLSSARVERKSLERLREQRLGEFQQGQSRAEQKTLDEIAARPRERGGE